MRDYSQFGSDTVFLIGNGNSRKDFDLELLKGKGTIIGCNALYRDFTPDILICQDAKMATELKNYKGFILTNKGNYLLKKNSIKWNPGNARTSGVLGMKFIRQCLKPKKCYLIGMDGFPGNMYAGTENYPGLAKEEKFYNKIIDQYKQIISGGNTQFINVNTLDAWNIENSPFYKFISYEEFIGELE